MFEIQISLGWTCVYIFPFRLALVFFEMMTAVQSVTKSRSKGETCADLWIGQLRFVSSIADF